MNKRKIFLFQFIMFSYLSFVFFSCMVDNKFAHSFGKRRYTKGYYFNLPNSKEEAIQNIKPSNQRDEILSEKLANNIKSDIIKNINSYNIGDKCKNIKAIGNNYGKQLFYFVNTKDYQIIELPSNRSILKDTLKPTEKKHTFFSNNKHGVIGNIMILIGILCYCISLLIAYVGGGVTGAEVILPLLISFIIFVIALIICLRGEKRDKKSIFSIIGVIASIIAAAITGLMLFAFLLQSSGLL